MLGITALKEVKLSIYQGENKVREVMGSPTNCEFGLTLLREDPYLMLKSTFLVPLRSIARQGRVTNANVISAESFSPVPKHE